MLQEEMEEYVELSRELVKVLVSDGAVADLKKSLDWQEAMINSLVDTQMQTLDLIRDLLSVEEKVAHTVLATEETKQKVSSRLHKIERELQDVCEKNASVETEMPPSQCSITSSKKAAQ